MSHSIQSSFEKFLIRSLLPEHRVITGIKNFFFTLLTGKAYPAGCFQTTQNHPFYVKVIGEISISIFILRIKSRIQ